MSQTSVRLIDFPRVEGSTRDVNVQIPQEPQADQTTADTVCQARHRRRCVAQSPLLNHPRGKINRSTLPSQVIRFSGQKLRSLIPDCCRILLRGNRRSLQTPEIPTSTLHEPSSRTRCPFSCSSRRRAHYQSIPEHSKIPSWTHMNSSSVNSGTTLK